MKSVSVDSSQRLQLPAFAVREIGGCELELASYSPRHLLLTSTGTGKESAVVLAGCLGEIAVPDLLSFLNMFRKSGVLHFQLSGGSKELYFHQGEISSASSTFPEHDLGEVLFSLGKIDRDRLQKARQLISQFGSLGRVLAEKGLVSAKDLWQASRHQAELIVYHLFTCSEGGYAFRAQPVENRENSPLAMSTQNLIMEGLRRVDERSLFMRRIGSLDALVGTGSPPDASLAGAELALYQLLSRDRYSVRELLRLSGHGEFDGLRLLYRLLEKSLVRLDAGPAVPVTGICGEILAVCNGALANIFRKISPQNPQFASEVRCFLRDLPQPFSFVFQDVALLEDGTVEGGRIMANLVGLAADDQKKLLVDALNELIFMECLIVRRELDSLESTELVGRILQITKRLKELVGRKE
jgi:hypothetical protein